MKKLQRALPWLDAGGNFPRVDNAWGHDDPIPGLLAAGGSLDVPTLVDAYSQGIFPWFSEGQPVLWWSPDPRMVLQPKNFKLHRSLRKTIVNFVNDTQCEIRIDHSFESVIAACAGKPRNGQPGTWILPDMIAAYIALHQAGYAHSVETWIEGEIVGGLYCVNLGKVVFGESMFSHRTDASKIALSALVAFCRTHDLEMIDCQQNTTHLASLGAGEISRDRFVENITRSMSHPAPTWRFEPLYWDALLPVKTTLT